MPQYQRINSSNYRELELKGRIKLGDCGILITYIFHSIRRNWLNISEIITHLKSIFHSNGMSFVNKWLAVFPNLGVRLVSPLTIITLVIRRIFNIGHLMAASSARIFPKKKIVPSLPAASGHYVNAFLTVTQRRYGDLANKVGIFCNIAACLYVNRGRGGEPGQSGKF